MYTSTALLALPLATLVSASAIDDLELDAKDALLPAQTHQVWLGELPGTPVSLGAATKPSDYEHLFTLQTEVAQLRAESRISEARQSSERINSMVANSGFPAPEKEYAYASAAMLAALDKDDAATTSLSRQALEVHLPLPAQWRYSSTLTLEHDPSSTFWPLRAEGLLRQSIELAQQPDGESILIYEPVSLDPLFGERLMITLQPSGSNTIDTHLLKKRGLYESHAEITAPLPFSDDKLNLSIANAEVAQHLLTYSYIEDDQRWLHGAWVVRRAGWDVIMDAQWRTVEDPIWAPALTSILRYASGSSDPVAALSNSPASE